MASDLFRPRRRQSDSIPDTGPVTNDMRLAWLRLIRSRGVGVTRFYQLMDHFGTAEEALAALPELVNDAGKARFQAYSAEDARREIRAARKAGARMVLRGEANYPTALTDLPDAPPLFWARGNLDLLKHPKIALVGARNASSLGGRMAKRLAAELGEAGFTVVSGLARGIDAAAHRAALPTGTIGVMAGGVDVIYPRDNTRLFQEIEKSGLILSEQPMGMQPLARHFPMRNRIVSGLAEAVIVVEAALKSGSLITARNALDQGREVMAVPGHPIDTRASGCNALIRDGAVLIRSAQDVIEALETPELRPARAAKAKAETPKFIPIPDQKPAARSKQETSRLHRDILSKLSPSPLAEDQLIRDLAQPAKVINPALTTLELSGDIERHPGGFLSLAVSR